MPKSRTHRLDTPTKIRALASPVRQEILAALDDRTGLAVREIAARLGRTPSSLYYHLDALVDAGVIEPCGERPRGKKTEALYRRTCERLLVAPEARSGAQIDATTRVVQSMLRQTSREIVAALQTAGVRRDGDEREIYGVRSKARLTRSQLRQVNQCIARIEKILASAKGNTAGAGMYAVTAVLTPSRDHQSEKDA